MSKIIKYEHHGTEVSVSEKNKGKHRENCLCYACNFFTPEDRHTNCHIAGKLYAICVTYGITTPVWECAKFKARG